MSIQQKYQFPFASYPAVRLALLMAAGIIMNHHLQISLLLWIGLFTVFAVGYISKEITNHIYLKSSIYNFSIISYLAMIIAFGGIWHSLFDYRNEPVEAQVLDVYTWQELTFSGTVQQIKQTTTGKYQIDVDVDTTLFEDQNAWPKFYTLRAIWDPDKFDLPDDLTLGKYLKFSATVYPLQGKRNPNEFDYKLYLASIGIYAQVGIKKIHFIKENYQSVSWTYIRQKIKDAIDNNFSEKTSALAKALLIGYKYELRPDKKIAFSRAGLSHIMAVSGLHVGFILAPFWLAVPLFWTLKYGKEIGLLLLIGLLFFYAGLTEFSASVSRACLAGGFLMYGRLFHKMRDAKNLTAVAALIILLINPNDLFDIGFQLSFGAVYIILLTTPTIYHWLPGWMMYRWYGKPVIVVIISVIVQIGLFPLLAYYFAEFSLIGPLANALVVPFLGFMIPFALLLLPMAMLFPSAAQLLNTPVDLFFYGVDQFVILISSLEWSRIQAHVEGLLIFGIWMSAVLLIATLPIPKLRWKTLCLFLLFICVDQVQMITQKTKPAKLTITFFDIGQGDAALVGTPNSKYFLIDTGRWQPDYNSAKYVILPHLKARGIDKLDAVFLSHPHADHIGGISELIDQLPIDIIYNSGTGYDSRLYKSYKQEAAYKNIPVVSLASGEAVAIDPAIRLFIYGPALNSAGKSVNNQSLILELIYGETEFLFMGDAETDQESHLIKDYPKLANTDFLKVGHHGSKTSSNNHFLDVITAQTAVVSLSKQNYFNHPHPQAIGRLRRHSISLHFTSLEGALQLYSDGTEIEVHK